MVGNFSRAALVIALGIYFSTYCYAKSSKEVKKDIENEVNSALKIYKNYGMAGLTSHTTECYEKTKSKSFKCIYFDLASRHIDQLMADGMNYPPTSFFSDEEFGPRIMPVFSNNNITDEKEMNDYLRSATPTIDTLVNKRINAGH